MARKSFTRISYESPLNRLSSIKNAAKTTYGRAFFPLVLAGNRHKKRKPRLKLPLRLNVLSVSARLDNERLQCAVAFFIHLVQRNEAQGSAVDAITQATKLYRPVIENMAKVRVAYATSYLNTSHTVACVQAHSRHRVIDRLAKTRPATAGIEFISRGKQRLACHDINIDARFLMLPELPGKRAFRSCLLGNPVRLGGKRFPQLLIQRLMITRWREYVSQSRMLVS